MWTCWLPSFFFFRRCRAFRTDLSPDFGLSGIGSCLQVTILSEPWVVIQQQTPPESPGLRLVVSCVSVARWRRYCCDEIDVY
ncbi:hypothetical protein QBC35DRAFT_490929 [Podospora australis]|uniref:Secreted protein n=1 Tax=Podospora australis TaxID=1536484 RepID=A0AAN6WXW5_9PEZI|nr:hypothetical protein QBC35DRAFT_490929 [Podospora australis]